MVPETANEGRQSTYGKKVEGKLWQIGHDYLEKILKDEKEVEKGGVLTVPVAKTSAVSPRRAKIKAGGSASKSVEAGAAGCKSWKLSNQSSEVDERVEKEEFRLITKNKKKLCREGTNDMLVKKDGSH